VKFLVTVLLALGLAACEKDDLGVSCAAPTGSTGVTETNPADNEIDFPATVRTDGICESYQCVSSKVRTEYCSRQCISNRNCPDGFECSQLQPVGPLKDQRFCLLNKTCRPGVAGDCPRGRFKCRAVTTSVPDQPEYFCDVKNDGEADD